MKFPNTKVLAYLKVCNSDFDGLLKHFKKLTPLALRDGLQVLIDEKKIYISEIPHGRYNLVSKNIDLPACESVLSALNGTPKTAKDLQLLLPTFGQTALKTVLNEAIKGGFVVLEGKHYKVVQDHCSAFPSLFVAVPKIDTSLVPKIDTSDVPKIDTSDVPKIDTQVVPEIDTTDVPKIDTQVVPKIDTNIIKFTRHEFDTYGEDLPFVHRIKPENGNYATFCGLNADIGDCDFETEPLGEGAIVDCPKCNIDKDYQQADVPKIDTHVPKIDTQDVPKIDTQADVPKIDTHVSKIDTTDVPKIDTSDLIQLVLSDILKPFTASEIANKTGVIRNHASGYKSGKRAVSLEKSLLIASKLGIGDAFISQLAQAMHKHLSALKSI